MGRLNRLPVVCLPLKLKRFRLNFSDNDIFPAFTRDFRIFVFAILRFLSLHMFFFFFAVQQKKSSTSARRKEEEKQWERAHCTQSDEAAAAKRKATKRSSGRRRRSISLTVIGWVTEKKKLQCGCHSLSLCRSLRCQRQLIWSRSRRGLSLPPSRSHTRTCIQCEGHCELKLNAWTFNMAVDKAIRRITERERESESWWGMPGSRTLVLFIIILCIIIYFVGSYHLHIDVSAVFRYPCLLLHSLPRPSPTDSVHLQQELLTTLLGPINKISRCCNQSMWY